MSNSIDQQFVEYVVKSLVGNPDAVSIERTVDDRGVLLELTVDPEDLGRVIGKRGATAQSLRTLLRALGTKNDARYNLKIVDNGTGPSASDGQSSSDDSVVATDDASTDESTEASEQKPAEPEQSDMVAKTRAELDELDDLDI
jgi:predicted RNA-binding protein YlqC (UPF0109 family)